MGWTVCDRPAGLIQAYIGDPFVSGCVRDGVVTGVMNTRWRHTRGQGSAWPGLVGAHSKSRLPIELFPVDGGPSPWKGPSNQDFNWIGAR